MNDPSNPPTNPTSISSSISSSIPPSIPSTPIPAARTASGRWRWQIPPAVRTVLKRGWYALLGGLLLAQLVPSIRIDAQLVWIALNMLYATASAGWAAFHWGPLWAARDESLRWSVSLTIIGSLFAFSYLSANQYDASGDGRAVVWFLMGTTVLGLPVLLLALCLLGAAIGAYVGRNGRSHRIAVRGVQIAVLTLLATIVGIVRMREHASTDADWVPLMALFLSFPLLTKFYAQLSSTFSVTQTSAWNRLRRVWERSLVRSIRIGRNVRVIDFRGATVGLLISILLLRLPASVVAPLQSQAFTTLVRIRSTLASGIAANLSVQFEGDDMLHSQREAIVRKKIVILQLDEATRFAISRRSEAAVQADMIALLRKYSPACIVLPMPALYGHAYPQHSSSLFPAPDDQDVEHNRRDTRYLASIIHTVHSTPDVVLAFPPITRQDDRKIELLLASTPLWSTTELPVAQSTCLPVVSAHWQDKKRPPLPAVICSLLDSQQRQATPPRDSSTVSVSPVNDLRQIPQAAAPHITPEGVTINFLGSGPERDFLHLSYSALEENTSVPVAVPEVKAGATAAPLSADAAGNRTQETSSIYRSARGTSGTKFHWTPASDLIRGKIVYLDALAHPEQLTPIGTLSQSEEQAYALMTLASSEAFNRVDNRAEVLLVLSLGVMVGLICSLKEPIDAMLQVVVPLVLTLLACMLEFFLSYWLDPVLPTFTILLTLTLATQMRFAHERDDRRRTSQLFGRFVAPHKVQEWLTQSPEDLGLGGKREEICVLFADVRNFTPFAERHDATEVIDVINAYMTAITDALHAYDGILDKYTGDGLMAFFYVRPLNRPDDKDKTGGKTRSWGNIRRNAPSDVDGDPELKPEEKGEGIALIRREGVVRAVRAALAMRDAAEALSQERARHRRPVLQLGFSLHYGEAVVGLVGNIRQQINYTALGHTVVVAARLQSLARGGEVVVSEAVYRETSADFDFQDSEPVTVKGISTPVHPYRVLGVRPHMERPETTP